MPIELLPLGGGERIAARVTEIVARGEFATWRAARVVGDHDLNTSLVRADPVEAAALQRGMMVWLEPASPPCGEPSLALNLLPAWPIQFPAHARISRRT